MIEKLGTTEARYLSKPCTEMIEYIEKLIATSSRSLTVAEIGVGFGATSVEIVKRLRKKDTFYFYSFQEEVDELFADLQKQDYCKCELIPLGNSHALYDSFCWNLGKQVLDKNNNEGLFDLVYLDGAHSFLFSGLASALLKMLIKDGGFIIFDDLHWSYGNSPDRNPKVFPEILQQYTQEQVDTLQIQMVVDIFMKNDKNWICELTTERRAIYKKKNTSSLLNRILPFNK